MTARNIDDDGCPVLALDTDDPEYARGVEVGMVWIACRLHPATTIRHTVHERNAEMMVRIAEATDRDLQVHDAGGEWMHVRFAPTRAEP